RRSNPQGRATQQSPGSASDGIRDHRQSKGGGGAWADASRQLVGARRRGDRIAISFAAPAHGSNWQILLRKSLMAWGNSDSVAGMPFAVEASDDGATQSRPRAVALFISS